MGTTDDISRLQREIKETLDRYNVSIRAFSTWLFHEDKDSDDEIERIKFVEKVKKQLTRPGATSRILATLERYLEILPRHPDIAHRSMVPPRNVSYPELDVEFRKKVQDISRSIDDALEEQYLEDDV